MFHLAYNLYYHCKHAGEQELNFAIVGLPNGGKTTIKKVMNGDNTPMVVPTIGATKPIELKVRFNIKYFFSLYPELCLSLSLSVCVSPSLSHFIL